jgi:hypothetical protein
VTLGGPLQACGPQKSWLNGALATSPRLRCFWEQAEKVVLVLAVVSSFDVGLTVHDERLIFAFVMSSEVEISLNLAAEANSGAE